MIQKIDIKDVSITEEIRKNLPISTLQANGLMSSDDRKRSYRWEFQPGAGKALYVGKITKTKSTVFSAISGNNGSAVTFKPEPLIFGLNHHPSTGMLVSKIGEANKWAYVDDGTTIHLYYKCNSLIGDGFFIISHSGIDLIIEFVDIPSGWISL